jgi:hypothetical protein
MAIIGQGVQAGLGRIDYSPYLQGAAAGAQGVAQGIASFGQSVGSGIQNYLKKEEEKKREQEGIEFIKNQFPGIDDKAAKAGLNAAGGPAAFVKFQSEQNAMREAAAARNAAIEEQRKVAQFAAYLDQGQGTVPSPVSLAAFTPEQRIAGESAYVQLARQRAERDKTLAEAAALRVPKPEKAPTGAEGDIAAKVKSFTSKFGRAPNDTEYEQIRDAVNASRKPTNITNVGPGLSTAIYNDLGKEKSDLFALREAVANYDTALNEITGSKAFSGPAGAIKYAGARALQMFGSDAFKSEADAYQAAGSALANSVLSIARQLPGASSDRDVIFLERVARGDERVPSAEVLMKIKARVEAKVARLDSALQSKIEAFGEAAKGDPNAEFAFKILSAKPRAQMPGLPSNF